MSTLPHLDNILSTFFTVFQPYMIQFLNTSNTIFLFFSGQYPYKSRLRWISPFSKNASFSSFPGTISTCSSSFSSPLEHRLLLPNSPRHSDHPHTQQSHHHRAFLREQPPRRQLHRPGGTCIGGTRSSHADHDSCSSGVTDRL